MTKVTLAVRTETIRLPVHYVERDVDGGEKGAPREEKTDRKRVAARKRP